MEYDCFVFFSLKTGKIGVAKGTTVKRTFTYNEQQNLNPLPPFEIISGLYAGMLLELVLNYALPDLERHHASEHNLTFRTCI
jgi:hypothetical protein